MKFKQTLALLSIAVLLCCSTVLSAGNGSQILIEKRSTRVTKEFMNQFLKIIRDRADKKEIGNFFVTLKILFIYKIEPCYV